jgi:DNA-binding HxlR family transcriptional regulator
MQPASVRDVQRTSFETMNCSVAQCLEVVGEWWSMLIIRDAFFGVRRFDDFQSRLGISRNILNVRLTSLVDAGVLERVPYQQRPLRHEYRLTDKGRDLWPVLTTMREWGDKWAAPHGVPLEAVHEACGEVMHLAHACSACGQPADRRSVLVRPGPGATPGDPDPTAPARAPSTTRRRPARSPR